MNHSPEPWEATDDGYYIKDAEGHRVARILVSIDEYTPGTVNELAQDRARRIIACVNELASVPDALLESGAVKKLLDPFLEVGLLLNAPVSITGPQPQSMMLEAFLNYVRSHPAAGQDR